MLRVTRIKGRPQSRRLPLGLVVTLDTARLLQRMHAKSARKGVKR